MNQQFSGLDSLQKLMQLNDLSVPKRIEKFSIDQKRHAYHGKKGLHVGKI